MRGKAYVWRMAIVSAVGVIVFAVDWYKKGALSPPGWFALLMMLGVLLFSMFVLLRSRA